jgi:hypothetical protein
MAYDRYLIAPINSGLQTDLKSWMTPEDSFERLNNAYVFRGRVRKRFGGRLSGQGATTAVQRSLYSRLGIHIATTSVAVAGGAGVGITTAGGAATGTVAGGLYRVGQQFLIGTQIFTVVVAGAPGVMNRSAGVGVCTYDTTNGNFIFAGATPLTQIYFYGTRVAGTVTGHIFKDGQLFSIGDDLYTVAVLGAPGIMLRTDGLAETATFNTTTGAYVIDRPANIITELLVYVGNYTIYYYTAEPVMGLDLYEAGAINNHSAFAFDTQFSYIFAGGRWTQVPFPGAVFLHGDDTNFVWSGNWNGLTPDLTYMFSSNYYALHPAGPVDATDDPIYYYTGSAWVAFNPVFLGVAAAAADSVLTAKIIVPFKDRLVLLRTIEINAAGTTNTEHKARCRFSHNGSPIVPASGPAVTYGHPWLEPNQTYTVAPTVYVGDGGGYVDAPTEEGIISAEFIKDRLIVFFERSTWELVYTGNQVLPFVWQKINTELGSESCFSSVPFDKQILTVGVGGIHACNGANVQRIDDKIPDKVFEIANEDTGVIRIAGVRDYKTEMVYWTYPAFDKTENSSFPNTVLVYNYKNGSWATNDDCITVFGYFEQSADLTWSQKDYTWAEANFPWNHYFSAANAREIIAGNQQGFVFKVDPGKNTNPPVMQITNMAYDIPTMVLTLTIINHTLMAGDYIRIQDSQGVTIGGYGIYKVENVLDGDVIEIITTVFAGTYTGGGVVARVSVIDILTKRFNPYAQQGKNVYLAKIDFGVQKTSGGEITVDYYPSSTALSMLNEATVNNVLVGTGVLETSPYTLVPMESMQTLLWHPVYFQADGQFIQLRLYLTQDQVVTPSISESTFQLEAMVLYTMQVSRLGQ